MIRVNRNQESDIVTKAINILEEEKAKENGTYNKEEVLDALKFLFNKKCYICENNNITSYNIEHLRPHRNRNKELKFGWQNLFLSCAHCNNIKSDKFENILDCTKVDVDTIISFRKKGNLPWEEQIEIKAIENCEEVDETVELLRLVYNGSTAMKKLESSNIRKQLRKEINKFIASIDEYYNEVGELKEDARLSIVRQLRGSSPFTAFKRWIIRDNREHLSEFLDNI